MRTTRTSIDGGWQVRAIEPADMDPSLRIPALPAHIPGHVHLDLHRAGVIPDPFYRLHERDVAWVDDVDWVYETTFSLGAEPEGDLFLTFLGLDTLAEIHLNDQPLGRTDNMFVAHEFDVGSLVHVGDNRLSVTFRSARRVGRERQAAWSESHMAMRRHHNFWDARSFVRKAQYMFGWDWGPVLISCGIWRPVEILSVPIARLLDWRYDVTFQGERAILRIEVTVRRASGAVDVPLTVTSSIPGGGEAAARIEVGTTRASLEITLDAVRRWSPDSPVLYPLELTLSSGEQVIDSRAARVGLRTVDLVREPDPEGSGESFLFRVNGDPVFCRGANWIPADSFPSRSYDNPERLRPLLTAARECGFNMLRVWGGGMYESDTFYELCDELGLMVWQDFPYACAYYPDDDRTLEAAVEEAGAAVRRLRVHPSLVLWCGNNENQQMYHDRWEGVNPPRFLGQALYDRVLPLVVAEEDPGRAYWPGSAYGGENPNSPDLGDRHNWNVWHGQEVGGGDWPSYADDRARFCSEFGFASSCGPAAWDSCLAPSDRTPISPAVRWHDKTRKGYDTYLGYIERHFPAIQSLDDLVYYSQLNQAEAMRFGVEHYRRLKGRCWGTLIWQLDDCWPVQSWAMIDYAGEKKAVYYAAKRFYAPILLSLVRHGETVEVWAVNDLRTPVSGRCTVRLCSFDGRSFVEREGAVSVGANAATQVSGLDLHGMAADPRDVFVHASLEADAKQVIENFLFLAEPRDLRLPVAAIDVQVSPGRGGPAVTLQADCFAAYVRLSAPGLDARQWSDNFFHMLPGRSYTVTLHQPVAVDVLHDRLEVSSLRP